MKLLLTSAGFTNDSIIKAFKELSDKPITELKLAFVPTAATVLFGDKGWMIDDLVRCRELGFPSIDIVDISALPRDIWEKRLQKADVFLFGGGNTYHLMYWLENSGLKTILPELLKTRIYVGISAGSMVTAQKLVLSDSPRLYSEEIGNVDVTEGLSFVDFNIRPHYNSPSFPNVNEKTIEEVSQELNIPIYAIDDDTAIQVVDDKITVVSEGEWKKFN